MMDGHQIGRSLLQIMTQLNLVDYQLESMFVCDDQGVRYIVTLKERHSERYIWSEAIEPDLPIERMRQIVLRRVRAAISTNDTSARLSEDIITSVAAPELSSKPEIEASISPPIKSIWWVTCFAPPEKCADFVAGLNSVYEKHVLPMCGNNVRKAERIYVWQAFCFAVCCQRIKLLGSLTALLTALGFPKIVALLKGLFAG